MTPEREFDFASPRQKNLIPDNNFPRYVLLLQLQEVLHYAWGPDVCAEWERDKWTKELPSFGMCVMTAMVVQKYFGGIILKDPDNDHYWNRFKDGTEADLSREQLAEGIILNAKETRTMKYMLTSEKSIVVKTPERYETLLGRVKKYMG